MNKSKHFAAAINPPVGSRKLPYLQIKTIQTMNFNPYYKISFNKPRQKLDMFDVLLVLVSLPASMSLVQLHFSYRHTRVSCAIKEVRIFPDEERSAVSIKQLWQVILQNFCTTSFTL